MDLSSFWYSLNENLPVLVTACVSVVTAFTSYLVVFIKSRKSKHELEEKNLELEKIKTELEIEIFNGSYFLCPSCGHKIFIKDTKLNIEKGEKNVSQKNEKES